MFKLASMFVEITARDDQLQRQLGGVQKQLGAMGTAIGVAVGNLAASAIASATSALGNFFREGLTGAMALQDAMSKTETVFGSAAATITDRADQLAKGGKAIRSEYINAATGLGALFKGAGEAPASAARLGKELADLAIDIRSFEGTGTRMSDVLENLQSGMVGNYEVLRKYRVNISAEAVEAEAVSRGLAKNKNSVDALAKAHATFGLIMKQTKDMQGDLERTFGSADNQTAALGITITELSQTIGADLIPVYTPLIQAVTGFARAIASSYAASRESLFAFGRAAAQTWDGFMVGARAVVAAVMEVRTVLLSGLLPAMGLVFGGIPGLILGGLAALHQFPGAIAAIRDAMSQALAAVADFTGGLLGVNDLATIAGAGLVVLGGVFFGLPGAVVAAVVAFTGFGGAIKEWVLDKAELAAIAWRNLPKVFEIAALQITEKVINIGEYFATLPENLSRIAGYIAGNWRQLVTDGVNAVGLAFRNLGKNILDLATAMKDWAMNPFGGFHFDWTDLLKDFEATAGRLPGLLEPALTSLQPEIDAKLREIGGAEQVRNDRLAAEAKDKAAPAKKAAESVAKQTAAFKSQTMTGSEFAMKMRASIYESGNKIPEQQLAAQNRTALASETTAAKVGAMAFTRLK